MRITGPVGEPVVAAVVGHPTDQRALERHRPDQGEHDLEWPFGLEAAVGEQAVEADGHAVADHRGEHRCDDDVTPGDRVADAAHHDERRGHQRPEGDDRGQHQPVQGPGKAATRAVGPRAVGKAGDRGPVGLSNIGPGVGQTGRSIEQLHEKTSGVPPVHRRGLEQ